MVRGAICPGGGIDAFERVLAKVAGGGEILADTVSEVGCKDPRGGVSHRGAGGLNCGPVDVVSGGFPCGVSAVGKGGLFSSFAGQEVRLIVTVDTCV